VFSSPGTTLIATNYLQTLLVFFKNTACLFVLNNGNMLQASDAWQRLFVLFFLKKNKKQKPKYCWRLTKKKHVGEGCYPFAYPNEMVGEQLFVISRCTQKLHTTICFLHNLLVMEQIRQTCS
jgi:hypothetical protein